MKANMTTPTWTETTRGLCPQCLQDVPARVLGEGGQVWLEQTCPRHGTSRALLASEESEYSRLRQFVPERTSGGGCCGGASETCGPPVCVLLLEITTACNLRCPTCYADARGHDFMSIDEAKRRLDTFFQSQPALDVLMLSGGEPTIHPQFAQMLELALSYPVGRVLVNTNGLRIAQSDALLSTLAAHKDRVELFFSFSSFKTDVQERLYGRDLRAEKLFALDRAQNAGLLTTLVATVEAGVNECEVGDLYRFALSRPGINGLAFQPVMSAGRYEHSYAPAERMTLTGILRALETQTQEAMRVTDFVGLPCSHPDCCAITIGLTDAARTTFTPLPRHLDVARYLELFSDRISFAGILGAAARRVWSDVSHLHGRQTLSDLSLLWQKAGLRDIVPLLSNRDAMARRVFRITVKPFMDAHTFDAKRIEQCCTKIVTETGEAVSFCAFNVLHRGGVPRTGTLSLTMAKARP